MKLKVKRRIPVLPNPHASFQPPLILRKSDELDHSTTLRQNYLGQPIYIPASLFSIQHSGLAYTSSELFSAQSDFTLYLALQNKSKGIVLV